MYPLRKLLVLAANELIAQGKLDLNGKSGDPRNRDDRDEGHIFADIAGRPSVIMWGDIGHDEIRVSIWWDYDHSKHPQANMQGNQRECFQTSSPLARRELWGRFVAVCASGWIERKAGKYLQGRGPRGIYDTYTRRDASAVVKDLPDPKPTGYKAEGPVH